MKRFQVRGPHAGRTGSYGRWTVVDTADKDITVHVATRKSDARDVAKELNEDLESPIPVDADESLIRALVEYCDTHPELNVSAYRLIQIVLDVDHIIGTRNPRKLLDAMDRLSDMGNE